MKKERFSEMNKAIRLPNKICWLVFFFGGLIFSYQGVSNPFFSTSLSDSTYQFLFTIDTKASDFTTDKLQQIYTITPQNEVVKYNSEGKEIFRFNNNTLGQLAHLDATNPFSLLLFYPDYLNVITLDRTLSKTGQFNFYDLNFLQINAIATSSDNQVWIFDNLSAQLKKIQQNGEIIVASDNLNLILGQTIRPNFILEKGQTVFVYDPSIGVLIFDVFGQYIKTLDFKDLNGFQIFENQLIYFQEGKLHAFHLQSLLSRTLILPQGVKPTDHIRLQKNRLYVLTKEQLKVYEFGLK